MELPSSSDLTGSVHASLLQIFRTQEERIEVLEACLRAAISENQGGDSQRADAVSRECLEQLSRLNAERRAGETQRMRKVMNVALRCGKALDALEQRVEQFQPSSLTGETAQVSARDEIAGVRALIYEELYQLVERSGPGEAEAPGWQGVN